MSQKSINYPPFPTGLFDIKIIDGFPGYAVGYDYVRAYVFSCWKGHGPHKPHYIGTKWWERKLVLAGKGYYYVGLSRNGVAGTHTVHTLLAKAFLGPVPDGLKVLHGVAGALCNLPCNLSYGTQKQNMADKLRDGTHHRGERAPAAKLKECQVREIFALRAKGRTQQWIADHIGVNRPAISKILLGQRWQCLGLVPKLDAPNEVASHEPNL